MNTFLNREEDPVHSLWASCSEPPAPRHNTNATADLGASYGTSATLGQHKTCPDRDDSERARSATTPPVPLPHDLSLSFVPLEHAYVAYDASLTYISDDVVLFWHPPSDFSQWTRSPFTEDLVEYNCAEQFMMASKARLFGDDTALSAILASNDPREQKRLGRRVRHFDHELWQSHCENIVLQGTLAKFSQNNEMRFALLQTGDRRLAEASPHDNPWGIGLSACDPRASSPDSWCGKSAGSGLRERPRTSSPRFYRTARQPRTGNPGSTGCHRRYGLRSRSDYSSSPRHDPTSCQCPNGHALGFHRIGAR